MTRRARFAAPIALAALAGCTSVSDKIDPLEPDAIRAAAAEREIANAPDGGAGAVRYLEAAVAKEPGSVPLRRALAEAYAGAGRLKDAQESYARLEGLGGARPEDALAAAFVAVRLDDWDGARAIASRGWLPATDGRAALLAALIADRDGDWAAADAAYARAVSLDRAPARALNNWGVSRMARGDLRAAAATFAESLARDPTLFAAKNNLVIARALGGDYDLPPIAASERERAVLLNNAGLVAARRGERSAARRLFREALAIHPQHFDEAARNLAALGG